MSNTTNLVADVQLSEDQQKALQEFYLFYTSTTENVFVIAGNAGCGKTTLVNNIIKNLPKFVQSCKLLNASVKEYGIYLTATTNKAADNLRELTNYPRNDVTTIHSLLGLVVKTDYQSNKSIVTRKSKHTYVSHSLIFIDEASYIDSHLLQIIFECVDKCKIVFIGDPAQLTPVKSNYCPVFLSGFKTVTLNKVMRQAENNPIINLALKFRDTVNTDKFFKFKPDNFHIQHFNKEDFLKKIEERFSIPNWSYSCSKVLAWTNACVVDYNNYIQNKVHGKTTFKVNDYALCNSYVHTKDLSYKANSIVQISSISPDTYSYGVLGNFMSFDGLTLFNVIFVPKSFQDINDALKKAKSECDEDTMRIISETFMDLRAVFACTINKSQGSTYDEVFIDLDNIKKCNQSNQVARMLYVAISRARHHVYLTGDIV